MSTQASQAGGGSSKRRDTLIAVGAGLLVLVFVLLAVTTVSRRVTGRGLTGMIVEKVYKPQPETQITIGKQGLESKRLTGEFIFEVKVPPEDKIYSIWVDKSVYDSHKVGDQFYFLRPPPAQPDAGPR